MKEAEKDTGKRILEATIRLMGEKGHANISTRHIAQAAGVALSQVTYYYKSKDNLLMEVVRHVKDDYLAEIEEHMQSISTPGEKIAYVLDFCRQKIADDTSTYVMLLDCYDMALWSEPCRLEFQKFFTDVAALLDRYISEDVHLSSEHSSAQIFRLMESIVFGTAMQYMTDRDNRELILESMDLAVELLKNRLASEA